jgi:tRNA pseudouridine32 synthase/23S rRNA pseudouridine746 synthase
MIPSPSRLYLPRIEPVPRTILEYLIAHFPHIAARTWNDRLARGLVTLVESDASGTTVTTETPYRHGSTVLYYKEVPDEQAGMEDLAEDIILYQDANILVADKPHGMVVTPSGDQVERSLLVRLQKRTGLSTLAPIHRLDRETAGVVLFAIHTSAREPYHRLFSERLADREYLAVGHLHKVTDEREWHVTNRMEEGEPWYRRRIAENIGTEPNAITRIERLESRNGLGFFRLRPETGKKHQLRVHMASIGFPIVGDLLYPDVRKLQDQDPPLQLLAHRLSFVDPLSGEPQSFTSSGKLLWPVE